MKKISALRVVIFLICCSISLQAKEHRFVHEGVDYIYELTFNDSRISLAAMREIWWLSPRVDDPPMGPFLQGGEGWVSPSGEHLVDKVFFPPNLELCLKKPGVNCDRDPEVPDAAFLENAARNLKTGDEQVERLQRDRFPSVLEPVRAYLLLHLKIWLEWEKARYVYLKSGDLGPMRRILCSECSCGAPQEMLLEQLKITLDGRKRLQLTHQWHNQALECDRKLHHPAYPHMAWKQFLKEFGIRERLRYIQID